MNGLTNGLRGGHAGEAAVAASARALFPDAARLRNETGKGRFLLACEHAGNAIPARFAGLGLKAADLADHIAWDIGAEALTDKLCERLDAPAVLARYSRLLCDCNRPPGAPGSIPAVSDGRAIPGNENLDEAARAARFAGLYEPFHAALDALLAERGKETALITIHSFTPVMGGVRRDLHAGVIFEGDNPLARALVRAIGAHPGIICRENAPYAARDGVTHTLRRHGAARGLPHAMIEIRNDLLRDEAGVERWAEILEDGLREALAAGGSAAGEEGDGES